MCLFNSNVIPEQISINYISSHHKSFNNNFATNHYKNRPVTNSSPTNHPNPPKNSIQPTAVINPSNNRLSLPPHSPTSSLILATGPCGLHPRAKSAKTRKSARPRRCQLGLTSAACLRLLGLFPEWGRRDQVSRGH